MQIKKILRTIISFGFLFHLLSCDNKENILPTNTCPNENSKNCLVNYTDPTTYINPKLRLLGTAQQIKLFTEYEEETASLPNFINNDIDELTRKNWIPSIQEADRYEHELACLLYDNTLKLANDEININDYLELLLIERYKFLHSRNKLVTDYLLDTSDNIPYVVPTNKTLAKWLDNDSKKAIQKYNNYIRLSIVRRYEMFNQLLRTCFPLCNIKDLKPETKKLLQASKQLHPILEGTRDDFGHPDEACGYYAILQYFFPAVSQKSSELPELSKIYMEIKDGEKTDKKLWLKKFTLCIHQHMQEKEKTLSPLVREILKLKQEVDLDIFRVKLAPLKNFSKYEIPSENVSWPYPLLNPAFLNIIKEANGTEVSSEKSSELKKENKGKKKRRRHKGKQKSLV